MVFVVKPTKQNKTKLNIFATTTNQLFNGFDGDEVEEESKFWFFQEKGMKENVKKERRFMENGSIFAKRTHR